MNQILSMDPKDNNLYTQKSEEEIKIKDNFFQLYMENPIPKDELLDNLALFINRQTLSNLLYKDFLYRKIIDVHGIICEFGVRWGRNLALFENFRGIYEPYNLTRKVVGFDTFEGFISSSEKDGNSIFVKKGNYSVTENYEEYLTKVLEYHEKQSPISHVKKFELQKGDASSSIKNYLKENPETIIALAYFDMDLYEPTLKCLQAIEKHLTRGSIIAFDELNTHAFPGETIALMETIGLTRYHVKRTHLNPYCAYIQID